MAGEPAIDHIYEQLSRPLLPTFWDEQERLWKTGEGPDTYFRYTPCYSLVSVIFNFSNLGQWTPP
jgi:hypothetical protein